MMPIVRSDIRCPFCGGQLWFTNYDDEGPAVWCEDCLMDAGHFDSMEQLEETFSRSPDDPMPCPLCGRTPQLFEDSFIEYGQGGSTQSDAPTAVWMSGSSIPAKR